MLLNVSYSSDFIGAWSKKGIFVLRSNENKTSQNLGLHSYS
jgi:hypothetical protein